VIGHSGLDNAAEQNIFGGVIPLMPNGVRNSIWALFFLAGMIFMATLIFMLRPELFSPETVRERPGSSIILGSGASNPDQEVDSRTLAPLPESTLPEITPPAAVESQTLNELPPNPEPQTSVGEPVDIASSPVPIIRPQVSPKALTSFIPITFIPLGRSVFGHVKLPGKLPPPKTLSVADNYCGRGTTATSIVSRVYQRAPDESLRDVLVFLSDDALQRRHWPTPKESVTIANRNCQFEPYITAIQAGQTVTFENFDPVLHNVHIIPTTSIPPKEVQNPAVNIVLLPKSRPLVETFNAPDFFLRVECNVHPYMVGYICVMPHPFFVLTKTDGRFEIPKVPPGEYTVAAVHRKAGWLERRVKVTDHESPVIEFVFEVPTEVARKE
jgi:plastocyanin